MQLLDKLPRQLVPFLECSELFRTFDAATLGQIGVELTAVQAQAGEIIIQEGDMAENLFLVFEGQLKVISADVGGQEVFLSYIEPGESVGEIALLVGGRRMATVAAVTDTVLLRLDRAGLARLETAAPALGQELRQAIWDIFERARLDHTLYVSRLLDRLDEEALNDLRAELELVHVLGGEILMGQGEPSDELYIVISGRLRVVRVGGDGAETVLLELGRGETVGEMGVLTQDLRTADVYAIRDSLLARLSKESFYRLMARHPHAMTQQFAAKIVERLRGQIVGARGRLRQTATTLAVVPAHSGVALGKFTEQLVAALGGIGRTLHLNSERVECYLGRKGIAQVSASDPSLAQLYSWLAEQESIFPFVVYESDAADSVWTQRCLRQADHVVWVGEADATEADSQFESLHSRVSTLPTFVLLHPPGTAYPKMSSAWRTRLSVTHGRHYHARLETAADFGRLARLLTGNGVGVVLSGGGARGLAHIGALRALREAQIPIDVIGGSSIGALIGCQFAMGWDHETVAAKSRHAAQHRFDYTLPATALMAGGEMTHLTQEMFGDALLEEMWLPCFCTSTNLATAALMIHTHGPVWKYTRASTSIPGILPPVLDGSDILVDGGLLNNLPTDVMRARPDVRTVIAIDVSVALRMAQAAVPPYESALSGWQVMWQRLNPFKEALEVPSMSEVLMGVVGMSAKQAAHTMHQLADFYVRISLDQYGMLEFKELDRFMAAGYAAVQEQLIHWQADEEFAQMHSKEWII